MENVTKIIELISSGNVFAAAIIVIASFFVNYKGVFEFFEYRKKARISSIQDALKNEKIDDPTRIHLEEELVNEQFKLITNVRIERKFRTAILQVYEKSSGDISFNHFTKALPHLRFRDGRIEVEIGKVEKFAYFFNLSFGFVLFSLAVTLMLFAGTGKDVTLLKMALQFGLGLFFMLVSAFMVFQTLPIQSAKFVLEEIQKSHNKSINSQP